ncbi:MAG TPA: hypothetical protein VGK47_07390, partial [Nitrososphaeraceae archaeon]
RIVEMSHEVISGFVTCVPIRMLYSSVQTTRVSASTESTSMARILLGPIPETSQFVPHRTTFILYN